VSTRKPFTNSNTRYGVAGPVDRVGETTSMIVRALKRRVDEGQFSPDDAVDVALLQVLRPGGPRLSEADRQRLRQTYTTLSTSLSPPTARAIYGFGRDASAAAWALHHVGRSPASTMREAADGGAKALATAAVYAELLNAKDDDDLLRRAVKRALSERRRGSPGRVVPLAKTDVRNTMAKAVVDEPGFGAAMRQAAVFARNVMEPALGEELWLLCRPLGFADQRRTRVLVATTSSVAAQETQLRARELLYRLQKLDALHDVQGVKVVVDARAFHRLVE
jgi:hypothetical protein